VGPDLGEVKRLFVDSDFRGRGLARNLMAAVEKRARELEMSTIRLETGTRQPGGDLAVRGTGI
jgi:GNAT superfamily N-acetyltransferase